MPTRAHHHQARALSAAAPGLYRPSFEHDSCGVGFVATLDRMPSRKVVSLGLSALARLIHRGAVGADARTGDGAGLLVEIPDGFLRRVTADSGISLPAPGQFAVGAVFLPRQEADRSACERVIEAEVRAAEMDFLGWRDVPCRPAAMGVIARSSQPAIRQCFIGLREAAIELVEDRLYPLRKRIEAAVRELPLIATGSHELFCVVSLSARTLIYKGQLTATQLSRFYPDLLAPDLSSRLAVFHQRFSTNTEPSWRLAQPFHFIAHNGEINTVGGNRNWMRARAGSWRHPICGVAAESIRPVIEPGGSDSAAFDNSVELLVRSGRPLEQAMMMMIPEAWEDSPEMDAELRGFYAYHANLMEPWDGPAAIAFSDGRLVGAALDRNGLRPARYLVTRGGLVVLASEAGVVDIAASEVLELGRLHPGQMLAIDTHEGLLRRDQTIKARVAGRGHWAAWERGRVLSLRTEEDDQDVVELPAPSLAGLTTQHHCFGYTEEELRTGLAPAAAGGHEAVASMGNDAALAALSERPRLLFDYFSQGFAQVTNPPIDSLRERGVMSLRATLGPGGDLLAPDPAVALRIELASPILSDADLARVRRAGESRLPSRSLAAVFAAAGGAGALRRALDRLGHEAERAVADGVAVLILSDRDVGPSQAPIPSLLALGQVHHHLIALGLRTRLSLVVESAEPRTAHHLAALIGHGAEAVNPYLALSTVAAMATEDELPQPRSRAAARAALKSMLEEGILKVMSKMGISTLASYCGSQLFEAVGISPQVIDRCFPGTPSRLGGAGFEDLASEVLLRHRQAFPGTGAVVHLEAGGDHRWRADGEAHAWNPETVAALQHAVRNDVGRRFDDFRRLADAEDGPRLALRHLLAPLPGESIPLDQVEPAAEIVRRFVTGAMSLGALGAEAHETLALAMNRIGGRSNTGEGGEDPARYAGDGEGGSRRSAIKQVASGRFGVTLEYLVNADEIQIKMAQGAKPGEGGQLPGHKVDATIARLRHATPGVGLISPPPHHDIYSIEDLAELIWDLKQANPRARISVKLVASTGVGTVAAGVAKARADHITISGHDGGTGAAPLTSIKHTGLPWELGLAETQQTLVRQGLRSRVVLQVDGGLRTGRDVVIAAMLGADEFGFATAALVASGCVLMRVCHLNTCPVGIATQDPVLRQRFAGTPEHVIRFFMMVAEDTRAWLAKLGCRSLEELTGRVDRLGLREPTGRDPGLDLTPLLAEPDPATARLLRGARRQDAAARRHLRDQEHHLERGIDTRILRRLGPDMGGARGATVRLRVSNRDRAVGSRVSSEVTRVHGGQGLPDNSIVIRLRGVAGQSLGAWLCPGVTVRCIGAANDYPGKGLSGGRLVVLPVSSLGGSASGQVIVGNVALYGATAGEAYFAGRAGERFAVRNSGAVAVVEGIGDHGCEYMTGGTVVVLGEVGRNFGAGMTGGVAYLVGAPAPTSHLNLGSVEVQGPTAEDFEAVLDLVRRHLSQTGSRLAAELLRHPDRIGPSLQVVRPRVVDDPAQPEPEIPVSQGESNLAGA